jgi:hypothetical protein
VCVCVFDVRVPVLQVLLSFFESILSAVELHHSIESQEVLGFGSLNVRIRDEFSYPSLK